MKINVETVPHNCQRYDTVGDWTFEPDGCLNVNVSRILVLERIPEEATDPPDWEDRIPTYGFRYEKKENEDSEFLVAIHEVIEAWLCKKAGISAEVVDSFDMNWSGVEFKSLQEKEMIGLIGITEPGNDPRAPYHAQHLVAQSIEMMLCAQLGLSWEQHRKNVREVK